MESLDMFDTNPIFADVKLFPAFGICVGSSAM